MKIFLSIVLLSAGVSAFAQEKPIFKVESLTKNVDKLAEMERFDQLAKAYMDYTLQIYPEYGVFIGKPSDNTRWTDVSFAAIEQRKKDREKFLLAINSISRSNLDKKDQANYDLLKESILLEKEGEQFPSELLPYDQMTGYQGFISMVASVTTFQSKKDTKDYLKRLQNLPTLIDQTLVLMNEGIRKGVLPPRITVEPALQQVKDLISADPLQSALLVNLKAYATDLPKSERDSLLSAASVIIKKHVNPSLEKLKTYLEKTYLPKTRSTLAMKDMPNGENWYNYRIKSHTTTTLTYKQIHEIGLQEVKRIKAQMDSLIRSTGFKGDFKAFTEYLKTDPKFYYEDSASLVDGYRVIAKRLDAEVPKFFGKLPRLPYGVIAAPEHQEKSQTSGYYMAGSIEAARPGYFYANTYDLKSRPKWQMEVLTIHEAVPGHHLQIALSMEMENVPEFKKYTLYYTAFDEGWGLYSESLGDEMGFYKDPYSKFGQLDFEIWRAIRLVVDTGIHGLGWTRDQAVAYCKANSANPDHDTMVEVDRYIAWPGQALAYKLGELKIKELRKKAQQKLGDKFDIRKFHDVVLGNGSVPLTVLETQVNEWVMLTK